MRFAAQIPALVLFGAAWLLPAAARASDPLPFHFAADAGCGDEDAFVRAFELRSTSVRLTPGPTDSKIHVELTQAEAHASARLTIWLEDGRVVERSLQAVSCDEALQAIAFVTALALRPDELTAAPVPTGPSASSPRPSTLPREPTTPLAEPSESVWTLGALATTTLGPAPGPLVGGAAELGLRTNPSDAWATALRLGAGYSRSQRVSESEGAAQFERWLVSLDFCPLHAVSRVTVHFCVQASGGAMVAEGTETHLPNRSVRPWLDLGWSVWPEVPLGAGLSWTTRLSVGIPLIVDSYRFDERTFHEGPGVVMTLETGLNFRVP